MAELDRLDATYGLGSLPSADQQSPTPLGRPRRRGGRRNAGVVVPSAATAVLLVGVILLSPSESSESLRRLVGIGDDRLAAAPPVSPGGGTYAFMQTQQGSDEPIGYDPCRTVEVAVNPQGAPANHDDLVDTGLETVARATGLRFVRVGDTTDRDVTGGVVRRRPVLIAWATPDEVPQLAGDVAGLGGSIATGRPGSMRYVTGSVMLDRDLFAALGDRDRPVAQAIVDHELGHLVGLAHVDDPNELMHEDGLRRTTFGPGDLEGLARLGNLPC